MDNFRKILFLKNCKGIGNLAISKAYAPLLSSCSSLEELKELVLKTNSKIALNELNTAVQGINPVLVDLERRPDIKTVTILDSEYPKCLHDMGYNKPPLLYYIGDLSLCDECNLAVVGTRKPSEWSKLIEPRLIKKALGLTCFNIVSGLALGCDTLAHEAALENGAKTIAVLPSGLSKIYPSKNSELAKEIIESGGCLISEYTPFEDVNKYSFIARDKIIAALSSAVIAIECGSKSGTMETIKAAHKLNRKIGCYYPEDMSNGGYSGNQLIVDAYEGVRVTDTDGLKVFLSV